jgi:transcriptional regulator with XRE-family HTH domain
VLPVAGGGGPPREIAGRTRGEQNMSTTLSEKVDRLFRIYPSPRGREYTYREVAAAISQQDSVTFSPAYLWQLRTGVKDNPTIRHLQALARFFDVSPAYFFDEELTEFPDIEVRLLAASRRETLRRMALTLLGLSDDSLNAVLALARRLRHLEGLPGPE